MTGPQAGNGQQKPRPLADRVRQLLQRGGSHESGAGTGPIADAEIVEAIAKRILARGSAPGEAPVKSEQAKKEAERIAAMARGALERSAAAAVLLSAEDNASLELIVRVVGRPALRFPEGLVEWPDEVGNENELWRVLISTEHGRIESLAKSVGRIDLEPVGSAIEPIGTGWRLGDNLIVTNRHVVGNMVDNSSSPSNSWVIDASLRPVIDFDVADAAGAKRVAIEKIGWCSDGDPDMAVLLLKGGSAAIPPAIPIKWEENLVGRMLETDTPPTFQGKQVYVVGHPYQLEPSSAITQVFGTADGSKRCSPGFATGMHKTKARFEHDCSTLGGNSGSCVVSADFHALVGMHYGGLGSDGAGRGTANVAIPFGRLTDTKAGDILASGTI